MNQIMFINPLDNLNQCYVAPDDARYGKYVCVYSTGENLGTFKRHIKGGFDSHADAIGWYFSRFPNGNVVSPEAFHELQARMLTLKLPSQPNMFNPTHMYEKPRPTAVKKTEDGQIMSDFE